MFSVEQESKKDNYGRFIVSPLEQGYGATLGTSLRRVLLTSLPGAAVTSVKISGIKHQFSTLKGMREDLVEFLLNLKKVRFSYDGEKAVKASLSVEGAKEVKAKDIVVEAVVKIANPDLSLAYLNKGSKLDVKMQIESGVGYSPSEERKTDEIGVIP